MFTIKTLIILAILALGMYIIRSVWSLVLQSVGLGVVSRMKKWGANLTGDKPGHIEASVDVTPAT